jgi:hypothetical protein
MSTPTSEATGIFQSDLLIRHAVVEGFKELRANQWLLDYVMAGIKFDDLTKKVYGQKDVDNMKKWFLKTDIPVIVYGSLVAVEAPAITIALQSSNEAENTLGDVHYVPQEDVPDGAWPDLTPVFAAILNVTTGLVTVPISVVVDIFPGMVIMDAEGVSHEILTVESERVFTIESGLVHDFSHCTLRAGSPATLQTLESAAFNETYQLGCHVAGEPLQLVFLHSLLCFILLRGRQDFLEGRGFEKSTFSSSDFAKNEYFAVENAWTRYITITGSVRQCWPKRRYSKITGVVSRIRPIGSGNLPSESRPVDGQSWIGDLDVLDRDSVG